MTSTRANLSRRVHLNGLSVSGSLFEFIRTNLAHCCMFLFLTARCTHSEQRPLPAYAPRSNFMAHQSGVRTGEVML